MQVVDVQRVDVGPGQLKISDERNNRGDQVAGSSTMLCCLRNRSTISSS